jgi:predicted nucleic acid-binding protein
MSEDFVVDNSVVMSWFFKDEANSYSDSVLDKLAEASAHVPSIWPLEVTNVLLVAERQKRFSVAASVHVAHLLMQLPILVESESPEGVLKDILGLAREQGLSSYDASYLNLAMKTNLPLATLDKKMQEAAKSVKVDIFEPS